MIFILNFFVKMFSRHYHRHSLDNITSAFYFDLTKTNIGKQYKKICVCVCVKINILYENCWKIVFFLLWTIQKDWIEYDIFIFYNDANMYIFAWKKIT